MIKFHNRVIEFGSDKSSNTGDYKQVKLVNSAVLIWFYFIVFFTIVDTINGVFLERKIVAHIANSLIIFSLSTILYFNKKHFYKYAKLLFMVLLLIAINICTLIVNKGKNTEYFFVLIPILSLILYTKRWVSFLFLGVAIICFFIPYYLTDIYTENNANQTIKLGVFALFVIVFYLTNYFKVVNFENEKLLMLEKDKVLSDKIILQNQEKKLRELNQFSSHFFVNFSHEIRTPLTLIKGYTSQINKKKLPLEEAVKLQAVEEQTHTMQSIIDDIMNLGKLDANRLTVNTHFVNINEFLLKTSTSFRPLFEDKEIQFTFESSIRKVDVKIDYSLFEKVITNLLSNALKFTPSKGVVTLKLEQQEEQLFIKLIDTGIGIPEESINKLFDRFYQVKNDITKSQGSGIGLAFVKSIINLHHFDIEVQSTLDVGSIFTILIPTSAIKENRTKVIDNPKELLKKDTLEAILPNPKQGLNPNKILIVDDHKQMRTYIKSIVSEHHIVEASNGKEAVSFLEGNNFDLIITDYMMPIMDGFEFIKHIKEIGLETPVIVLTARTDTNGKLKMLRLGVDSYLCKPFLEEELKTQINKSIQLYDYMRKFKRELTQNENELLGKEAVLFYNKLQNFINKRLNDENFKVQDIADYFNVSNRTLNRKTKTLLGQSAQDLILEARLLRVKQIMEENPDKTKAEIALSVGLKNTSYLFKKFKLRFHENF